MEIFGGFMVMMSIIGLFLAVVWLIMPFVVFTIKGKLDRSLEILEGIDKRLAAVEQQLKVFNPQQATSEITAADMEETVAPASDETPRQELLPLE
jgi:hypothetical protein